MKNKCKNILTKKFFEVEYIKKKLSARTIAKINDISKTSVLRYLKKYNIKLHKQSPRGRSKKYKHITKLYLVNEYINKNNMVSVIAKKINCAEATIFRLLKQYSIPLKKSKGKIETTCSTCNKKIFKHAHVLKNTKNNFCSKECFKVHRSKYNPMYNKKTKRKSLISRKKLPKRINLKQHIYCCLECGAQIHWKTAMYGDGRCKKCAHQGDRGSNFGKTILIKFCSYKNIWFKSSWEANFAKWCDGSEVKWQYEPKAFLLEINNKKTNYTPDFYLPELDVWVEVKGYWRKDAKEKFIEFKKRCEQKIYLFNKEKLQEFSIIK